MSRFKDRVAVVTGGAGGIGAATAKMIAEEGGSVMILDANGNAADVVAETLKGGGRALASEVDVRDPASVRECIVEADRRLGRLDILVNCAGLREITPSLELEPARWREIIDVNLSGTFYACQSFAKAAIAAGRPAAIVNVSSTSSIFARPSRAAYVSSKHAISGLTKQLALELGQFRIRVNAVAPGVVRTPLTEKYFTTPENERQMVAAYPLGRVAVPEDVASVILFLASDRASYITGATVPVDGGYSAGKAW